MHLWQIPKNWPKCHSNDIYKKALEFNSCIRKQEWHENFIQFYLNLPNKCTERPHRQKP